MMQIHSYFNLSNSFFKKIIIDSFDIRKRKILAVVGIVFGCLATICFLHYWSRINKIVRKRNAYSKKDIIIHQQMHQMMTRPAAIAFQSLQNTRNLIQSPVLNPSFPAKSYQVIHLNGETWKGTFDQEGFLHGEGKLTMADGTIKEGTFSFSQLHGRGTVKKNNGTLFDGWFANNKLYEGEIHCCSGLIMKGTFKKNRLEGSGTIIEEDGTQLIGLFSRGLLEGEGTIQQPNGTVLKGNFHKGKLWGQGKIENKDGSFLKGNFANGYLEGEGQKQKSDGILLTGRFQKGEFISGILSEADGTLYQGTFEKELLVGKGFVYFPDKTFIEGNFVGGLLKGEALICTPNGNITQRTFSENDYTTSGLKD